MATSHRYCCRDFYEASRPGTDNEGYGAAIGYEADTGWWGVGSYEVAMKWCPFCGREILFKEVGNEND